MTAARTRPESPAVSELVEGVLFYPIALVISATIFPGLTICIPGLILMAAFVVIPLVAAALVLGLIAAVVAAPWALVRGVRALVAKRREMSPMPAPITAVAQR